MEIGKSQHSVLFSQWHALVHVNAVICHTSFKRELLLNEYLEFIVKAEEKTESKLLVAIYM